MNKETIERSKAALKEAHINPDLSKYLLKYGKESDYEDNIRRLINKEPVQYILNSVNFYGYDFYVDKNVLIPRFETEELIYYTKKYIDEMFVDKLNIIDVGTGSGCIATTLKKEFPLAEVDAIDISKEALEIAKYNAALNNVKINFYLGDMLNPAIKGDKKFDVIISNPPYIKEEEQIDELVLLNEPSIALYGGVDGLKYYKNILSNCLKILKGKYLIAFEIGLTQADEIKEIAYKCLPNSKIDIKKDMIGRNRFVFIRSN